MASVETLSEKDDDPIDRRKLIRSCCARQAEENDKTRDSSGTDRDSEAEQDHSSDEDYTLNGPKKKRKKKVKKLKKSSDERRLSKRSSKNKAPAPSFEQVMVAQINHAYRFADFDDYESEDSSIIEQETIYQTAHRTPTPEPPKERKKRVIIYPWRPIGITGGRPVGDVSKL